MKPAIIIIGHSKMVGKDTFFSLINKLYPNIFYRLAFADALKSDLEDISFKMFGKSISGLTQNEKEILRPVMIEFGCAFRKIDPLHWVKAVHKQIDEISPFHYTNARIPIITDGRFSNEISYFKDIYFEKCVFVEINRIGAPEPTDEEKRNIPLLKKYVDYSLTWPTSIDNFAALEPYIHQFYNKYFL
jgi:hypothetical protein